jgi:hypothetical protein
MSCFIGLLLDEGFAAASSSYNMLSCGLLAAAAFWPYRGDVLSSVRALTAAVWLLMPQHVQLLLLPLLLL